MRIGSRIRKIREIKGFSQENLAFDLGMSVTGYGKIERDEVSVNFHKLEKIASLLGVNIETIIGFDENIAFNNFNSKIENQIGHNVMPKEMKTLFEDNIKLLKEKIVLLENEIERLKKG